ncbi:hypothetical protein QJU43_06685 [Pasteurella atlantica]|uniref:dual OB domain-containing protein n=1 Tax=Pasteurellaceae TaxID=712 RepID=UPI00274D0896|nr:hypothetical protein [Pasteurella atlantica]MDP8033844.1 hypothetical protein [Pasteurella atlantica]MDP8035779.1 hypothetical protein [Pasteurella atlantica]MDP8037686.1 hypothetical protein [Pasteurella atlantica]MDP8048080.1 hypothetical protein [Pasteurella atlantica]MDP8050103.1 hypothetical protein [Pasteurella atlantica]
MEKEIVILAKSIKHNGYCVAGKYFSTKQWVRLVSNSGGGQLSFEQVQYENIYGRFEVKPLQRMKIGLVKEVSLINQPENWLIDNRLWVQNYRIEKSELYNYLDKPEDLWGDSHKVNYNSIESRNILIEQSLYLVKAHNLNLYITEDQKRRAKFCYNNINYDLPVTDPEFDNIFNDKNIINNAILCISLGEEFNGYCYKIVATIFECEEEG